jgi:hypothetical protein
MVCLALFRSAGRLNPSTTPLESSPAVTTLMFCHAHGQLLPGWIDVLICNPVLVLFDCDGSHFYHLRDRYRANFLRLFMFAYLCHAVINHRLFRRAIFKRPYRSAIVHQDNAKCKQIPATSREPRSWYGDSMDYDIALHNIAFRDRSVTAL